MTIAPHRSAKSPASIDPIFIVGAGRSGTTLLVNLMGSHPLLAPIYETPFLRKVLRYCERVSRVSGLSSFRTLPWLFRLFLKNESRKLRKRLVNAAQNTRDPSTLKQDYEAFPYGLAHCIFYTPEDVARETDSWIKALLKSPLSEEEIYCSARHYTDRLFSIHCARLNKHFWVNKTPALLNYADRLSKLYPSARCIHVLRDGRDAAVSLLSLPWGPKTMAEAARHWRFHVANGRLKLAASKLPFIEVEYKNLVDNPELTLARIFSFLEMEADPSQLVKTVPVYRTKRETWKLSFSAEDRLVFHREAGDLLIELGYEDDESWVR